MFRYRNLPLIVVVLLHLSLSLDCQNSPRCTRPEAPPNGRVWFRRQGSDHRAIYTCDAGYVLVGSNVSLCLEDQKQWSHSSPHCRKADCSEGVAEESLFLQPGKIFRLICDEVPSDSFLWLKDDVVLSSKSSVLELNTGHGGQVEGHYVCLSRNKESVRVLRAVNVRIAATACKNPPKTIVATIGTTVYLSCPANPPRWTHDNQTLSSSSRHSFLPNGNLAISEVLDKDAGMYGCASCPTVQLIVSGDPCGMPLTSTEGHRQRRIVDGVRAPENSAPWMCMLSSDREAVICGCSLVANRWVVTAAHCLSDAEDSRNLVVKLGKRQRRQKEPGEIVRTIKRVVSHPNYRRQDEGTVSENDIALVELVEDVTYDRRQVLPICLPPASGLISHLGSGASGVVTGWGRVSVRGGITALSLQMAELPLVPREQCQKSSDYTITEGMLCAGFAESFRPDTCSGDSGGPLAVLWQERWYLAGVISWGQGCSSPGKYGIYTNVEKYVDWMRTVLN